MARKFLGGLDNQDAALINVGTPTNSDDAANKAYVDGKAIAVLPSALNMNYLQNPSFEDWGVSTTEPTGWSGFWHQNNPTPSKSTNMRTGAFAIRLTSTVTTSTRTYIGNTVRVQPNQPLYAEAWFYKNNANASQARIYISLGNGTDIGPFGANILEQGDTGDVVISTSGVWTKISLTYTPINAASTYALPQIIFGGANGAVVDADDFFFAPVVQTTFPNPAVTLANVGASTAETSVAAWTIPANTLGVNTFISMKYFGQVASTATITYRIRIGPAATAVASRALVAVFTATAAGASNVHTYGDFYANCLTTGTSGTMAGAGQANMGAVAVGQVAAAFAAATVNTTIDNVISITSTFSATASNALTSRGAAIEFDF